MSDGLGMKSSAFRFRARSQAAWVALRFGRTANRLWVFICTALLLLVPQPGVAQFWQRQSAGGITYMGGQAGGAGPVALPKIAIPQRSLGGGPGIGSLTDLRAAPSANSRLLATAEDAPWFQPLRPVLQQAAQRHRVDYQLIKAVIAAESAFNPAALSPKGAVGLMQLMPATASRFGVTADARQTIEQKLADPATNIGAGTRYLRYLLDLFPGRTDLALAAYNAGEGAVQRAGNRIPQYEETQDYTRKVMGYYDQLAPAVKAAEAAALVPVVKWRNASGEVAPNVAATRNFNPTAVRARLTSTQSAGTAPDVQPDVRMIVGVPVASSRTSAPAPAPAPAPAGSSFYQGGIEFLVGGGTPVVASQPVEASVHSTHK